jgi:hypothetical protein
MRLLIIVLDRKKQGLATFHWAWLWNNTRKALERFFHSNANC